MWVIIGWLLVFAFPLVVIYLTGGINQEPLLDDEVYERRKRQARLAELKKSKDEADALKKKEEAQKKKKNKKKAKAVVAAPQKENEQGIELEEEKTPLLESKRSKKNKKKAAAKKEAATTTAATSTINSAITVENNNKAVDQPIVEAVVTKEEKVSEIDEHMDPTAKYARVMRIKPEEEEDEWESVPYEEGWSQVKTSYRRPTAAIRASEPGLDVNAEINNSFTVLNSNLDKKQRENLTRNQKKKEAKAAADKLQEERLKKHKKELEKIKIQEFYSSGKGKNTPWGKNGQKSSSKMPQSVASVNEFGQLIWE